jgi:hypothetical protein
VLTHAAETLVDEELGAQGFTLRPGEHRRLLLDLSALLPQEFSAGAYRLELEYGERGVATVSGSAGIRFGAPRSEQRTRLEGLRPRFDRARSWAAWSELLPFEEAPLSIPRGDPLAYYEVLRYLRARRDHLGDVDPAVLDVLPDALSPEREILAAEILRARGRTPTLSEHLERLRALHPGLRYWLDALESGRSLL